MVRVCLNIVVYRTQVGFDGNARYSVRVLTDTR